MHAHTLGGGTQTWSGAAARLYVGGQLDLDRWERGGEINWHQKEDISYSSSRKGEMGGEGNSVAAATSEAAVEKAGATAAWRIGGEEGAFVRPFLVLFVAGSSV